MNHRDNPLACWLVTRAARHAPPELAARLEEEWLADLNTRRSALAQIGFALGCSWATQVIAHDAIMLGADARGVLGGQAALTAFAPTELAPGSNRSTVVMLVVALHVVVIYAFLIGIIPPLHPDPPPKSITATVLHYPVEPPLPPPGPVVDTTHRSTPIPLDPGGPKISYVPDAPANTGESQIGAGVERLHAVARVLGGPGAGFPNTDSYYPAGARRDGETGAAGVRVCVDERGQLLGEPTIAATSGSARLDQGALALARAGSGHYRSTTEDGKPVSSCYAYRVRFQIR